MSFDAKIQDEFIQHLTHVQTMIDTWKLTRTETSRAALVSALLEARRHGSTNALFLVGFPDPNPDPPAGLMVCRVCGRGMAECVTLYRANQPGELPALWDCADHADLSAVDPIVRDITDIIKGD
jgi:hypothetical protein